MKKHEIDLLIVEDNEAFSLLLERELCDYLNQEYVKSKYDVSLFKFINSDECIQTVRKRPSDKNTITFIDYYLGEAINGLHILKLLIEKYKSLQVVLMSRSPNVREKIHSFIVENINVHFIVKDEYTPAMCKVILESYLENL